MPMSHIPEALIGASRADGTHPAFTPKQRIVAQLLAAGFSQGEVQRCVRVAPRTIRDWKANAPGFAAYVEHLAANQSVALASLLAQGEELAVVTALEVMQHAETDKGKPDYRLRLSAAVEFLNRRGERGMPVARQQIQSTIISGDVEDAIKTALRDPGVKAWLSNNPEAREALGTIGEVEETRGLLPSGPDPARADERSESASAAPLPNETDLDDDFEYVGADSDSS